MSFECLHPGEAPVNGGTGGVAGRLPGNVGGMRALLACLVLAACGGGGGSAGPDVKIGPTPEAVTRAVLSGPLCEGTACKCRKVDAPEDGGAGVPEAADVKRYEFHVGPAENGLWVSVDDMVLYKNDEHAEDCFYLDLRPGDHKVVLRASRGGGFSAALDIHEYGVTTKSWYDTFTFSCGSPGTCSYDALDEWKASLDKYKRSLHDPCGSTKVKGIQWDAGRAPDQMHPQDLELHFTLDIYEFAPDLPHGHADCADRFAE